MKLVLIGLLLIWIGDIHVTHGKQAIDHALITIGDDLVELVRGENTSMPDKTSIDKALTDFIEKHNSPHSYFASNMTVMPHIESTTSSLPPGTTIDPILQKNLAISLEEAKNIGHSKISSDFIDVNDASVSIDRKTLRVNSAESNNRPYWLVTIFLKLQNRKHPANRKSLEHLSDNEKNEIKHVVAVYLQKCLRKIDSSHGLMIDLIYDKFPFDAENGQFAYSFLIPLFYHPEYIHDLNKMEWLPNLTSDEEAQNPQLDYFIEVEERKSVHQKYDLPGKPFDFDDDENVNADEEFHFSSVRNFFKAITDNTIKNANEASKETCKLLANKEEDGQLLMTLHFIGSDDQLHENTLMLKHIMKIFQKKVYDCLMVGTPDVSSNFNELNDRMKFEDKYGYFDNKSFVTILVILYPPTAAVAIQEHA